MAKPIVLITRMHTATQYVAKMLSAAGWEPVSPNDARHRGLKVGQYTVTHTDSERSLNRLIRPDYTLMTTKRDNESIKATWMQRYGALSFRREDNRTLWSYGTQLRVWTEHVAQRADYVIDATVDAAIDLRKAFDELGLCWDSAAGAEWENRTA